MESNKHHRSLSSIKHISQKLEIYRENRNFWSDDEISVMLKYYPIEGPDVYKRLPGRSKEKCRNYATMHGIKISNRFWTDEQKDVMNKFYPKLGARFCSEKLKTVGRDISKDSCCSAAKNMGLSFNGRGVIRIEDNKYFTLVDAANEIGFTQSAIIYATKHGNICGRFHWRDVTEEDCD